MLKKLDAKLNLRAHYSNWRRDVLSRMWFENTPLEWFHKHYLSRVSVEFDDYSGVLVIKTQGYDAKTAHAIAEMLVQEGERFMNFMGHSLAQEQVTFLEKQVADMNKRVVQARQAVLSFQNQKGLVSPQGTAESLAAVINRLESQRIDLQTRRAAMLGYLMPNSPNVVELNMQIAAVEKQIAQEKARLTSPNEATLNRTVEEFQRLELEAQFALDVYKTALVALETGRVEATRTLKKVSVLQSPFEPQHPVEPRRIYNTVVFILAALLIAGIMHLLAAIIRDHKD
jgi:capsular polysaccharide transport system permease protein